MLVHITGTGDMGVTTGPGDLTVCLVPPPPNVTQPLGTN